MGENCARCGHSENYHWRASCTSAVGEDDPCPCPGYRTQAQQEAWASARQWLDVVRANCGIDPGPGGIDGIAERLLELYP